MVIHSNARARGQAARQGMTLVEMMIAVTVFAVLMGGVMRSMQSATGLMESTSAVLEVDRKARRFGQELRGAFENAGGATLAPQLPIPGLGDPTPFLTDVRFQTVRGWSAGSLVLGPVERIFARIEPTETNNGLDDDGDGLIDELELVHIPDEASGSSVALVLARGVLERVPGEEPNGVDDNGNGLVDEPGFSITQSGDRVTVRWAIGIVDDHGTTLTRESTFQIDLQP